jgi:hypothetical protein
MRIRPDALHPTRSRVDRHDVTAKTCAEVAEDFRADMPAAGPGTNDSDSAWFEEGPQRPAVTRGGFIDLKAGVGARHALRCCIRHATGSPLCVRQQRASREEGRSWLSPDLR